MLTEVVTLSHHFGPHLTFEDVEMMGSEASVFGRGVDQARIRSRGAGVIDGDAGGRALGHRGALMCTVVVVHEGRAVGKGQLLPGVGLAHGRHVVCVAVHRAHRRRQAVRDKSQRELGETRVAIGRMADARRISNTAPAIVRHGMVAIGVGHG